MFHTEYNDAYQVWIKIRAFNGPSLLGPAQPGPFSLYRILARNYT